MIIFEKKKKKHKVAPFLLPRAAMDEVVELVGALLKRSPGAEDPSD